MQNIQQTIERNLFRINNLIAEYEQTYQRPSGSVRLLAASKAQSIKKIRCAFNAGQTLFGENYVQEAIKKMLALNDLPIEWHFIGRIQRNKTKKIAEHFSWVHSVATTDIAERLNAQRPIDHPPLNICIEVNISHEETKAGIAINHVLELADVCLRLPQLKLRGLMAIPAPFVDFAQNRREFHKLQVIQNVLRDHGIEIDTLSIGMSHDFEAAIAEGATIVRIGTAIFGARRE